MIPVIRIRGDCCVPYRRFEGKRKPAVYPGNAAVSSPSAEGDAFASRNAYALEIDFEEEPPMFRVTDSHYAATWLLDERAPKVVPPIGGNTDGT